MKTKRFYGPLLGLLVLLIISGSVLAQTTQFTTTDEFDSGTKTDVWTQTDSATVDFGTVEPAMESIPDTFPDIALSSIQVNTDRPRITLPSGIEDGDWLLIVGTTEDLLSQSCLQGTQLWYIEFDDTPSGDMSSWACEIWADGTEDGTVAGMDTTNDNEWGVMAFYAIRDHTLADSESPHTTQSTSNTGFDADSPSATPPAGVGPYLWITVAGVTGMGGAPADSMTVTTWPANYDDGHAVGDIEMGSCGTQCTRLMTALSARELNATTENPPAYDVTCTASPCNVDGHEGWVATTIAVPGTGGVEGRFTSSSWSTPTFDEDYISAVILDYGNADGSNSFVVALYNETDILVYTSSSITSGTQTTVNPNTNASRVQVNLTSEADPTNVLRLNRVAYTISPITPPIVTEPNDFVLFFFTIFPWAVIITFFGIIGLVVITWIRSVGR